MGFGGINPCSQTHGAQKFWSEGQTPLKTLKTGNYTPVPIFAGACANDGTLVLSGTRQYIFFLLRKTRVIYDATFSISTEYKQIDQLKLQSCFDLVDTLSFWILLCQKTRKFYDFIF